MGVLGLLGHASIAIYGWLGHFHLGFSSDSRLDMSISPARLEGLLSTNLTSQDAAPNVPTLMLLGGLFAAWTSLLAIARRP
jgi:hypothetical protein